MSIYRELYGANGDQNWWPAETVCEVCIGAILTQNTSWSNVERAILNLKAAGLLELENIVSSGTEKIAELIRPSGYFNQKAVYIREFCSFLKKHNLKGIKDMELMDARDLLLSVKGIGKETADSILLYALDFPIFVIDAYTKRIFSRLGLLNQDIDYEHAQEFFMSHLLTDVELFKDYHAQIVNLAKYHCTKKPKCTNCPLKTSGICRGQL